MKLSGHQELDLNKTTVWEGLNNQEILEYCIPGCEKLDQTDDNNFNIVVLAKVGPIKTRFTGTVQLTDINPPESYRLVFSGNGGSAGTAKGDTLITLAEKENKTVLNYESNVSVTGKLAQIGNKLIDGASKAYATQFFESFVETIKSSSNNDEISTGKEKKEFILTDLIDSRLKIIIYTVILIIVIATTIALL